MSKKTHVLENQTPPSAAPPKGPGEGESSSPPPQNGTSPIWKYFFQRTPPCQGLKLLYSAHCRNKNKAHGKRATQNIHNRARQVAAARNTHLFAQQTHTHKNVELRGQRGNPRDFRFPLAAPGKIARYERTDRLSFQRRVGSLAVGPKPMRRFKKRDATMPEPPEPLLSKTASS